MGISTIINLESFKHFKINFSIKAGIKNDSPFLKFSEKELGRDYNNLDSLTSNPLVKKHAIWASKQK